MRIRVHRQSLLSSLQKLSHLTKGKTLPLLKDVLLYAEGGDLIVAATDLESTALHRHDEAVESPGQPFAIDRERLARAVDAMGGEEVIAEVGDGFLNLGEGMTIRFIPADAPNFPTLPSWEPGSPIALPFSPVVAALSRAYLFASKEESRSEIASIQLTTEKKKVSVSSTNGRRLWYESLPIDDAESTEFLIPSFAAKLIDSLPSSKELRLARSDASPGHIYVWSDDSERLMIRAWEGTFPNVETILKQQPEASSSFIAESGSDLVSALRRAAVVSQNANLICDKDGLMVAAFGDDTGSVSVAVSGESETEFDLSLPIAQLIETCSALDAGNGNIILQHASLVGGGGGPLFLTCSAHPERISLVMPMRR